MEVLRTYETSVYFYESTLHYIPEGCNLHTRRRENLKFHTFKSFPILLRPQGKMGQSDFS
jgi:hypothetical protein